MNKIEEYAWNSVKLALSTSKGISWDGCHKIYILMDDESLADQYKCGYGTDEGTYCLKISEVDEPFETIRSWWDESCGLRFINGIVNGGHTSKDFIQIIRQFDEEDWDDE